MSQLPESLDQASRELSVICDADGTCTWADARATRLLGVAAGTRLASLAAPGTEGKLLQLLAQGRMQEVQGWELSLVIRGQPVTARFSATPHGGGVALLGSVIHEEHAQALTQLEEAMTEMVGLNREIARQQKELKRRHDEALKLNQDLEDSFRAVKTMHAELEDRADALRRSVDVRGRVVANVSHEFRTPLHAILGLSQLLLDQSDGPLMPEQRKQVGFIRAGAEQLSQMVNDLLDLSKIEAGKVLIRSEKFSIYDLFRALRGMLAPLQPAGSKVALVFEEVPESLTLETDRAKTSQVMRNLIANALKFTETGEVRVSAAQDKNGVTRLTVKDTGMVIAPGDQQRIFEEFEQIGSAREQGTGLGLAISRRLAALLNGKLDLESDLGAGASFTLTLPRIHPEVKEMQEVTERSQVLDPQRQPVLVVEDDRKTMFVYERYLSLGGFQVIPARTVEEAREAMKRVRPAAILLDIMLERESTWAFLAELKKDPETIDIPVLVVTITNKAQKARALGADEFWLKPIDKDRLLKKLHSIATPPGMHTRVLVIDDDERARYVLRKHLEQEEFRLFEASSGPEGVTMANQHLPNVIFLDFLLRDQTAFDVLDELKANPRTRGIPVIINTAQALDEDQIARLGAVTESIVSKEHLSRELALNRIRDALAQAGVKAKRSDA